MKIGFTCLTFLLFFISTSVQAQLQSTTIGDAINQGNNCFTITPDLFNQVGGVWFSNPIDFDEDFTIYYQNNFGTKDDNGADGMALVFKTTSTPELGNVGGGMGYEGITNSMVVEFDTFENDASLGNLGDPTFDHISIQRNGIASHLNTSASLTPAVPMSNSSPNVEDGIDHEVKIVWEASSQLFTVFFDCEFVVSLNLDIKAQIFNGDDTVYFGFVGSTGGSSNLHQVCFNSISFVDDLQLQDETICAGESISIDATLPSGSSYSWSPVTGVENPSSPTTLISPTVTTTYTVTIQDNCGESSTEDITITVLDTVEPTFDAYPEYTIGDDIPPLPTTSNNGISGSWSPAIDNTQTTTYTFTPDPGQCGTIETLTIIVNSIDTDGDGITDDVDIDDDNDGILDINEGQTTTSNEFQQNFGVGGALLSNTEGNTNVNVLSGDWYEGRSVDMPFFWCQTDTNGDIDGSGNVNGRYLALDNNTETLVYQQTGIPVIENVPLAFSVRVANLEGSGVEPDALLRVRDANGVELGNQNLVLPNEIVDQWQTISLNFIPTTNTITIEIENQETGIIGNVVGLDEITVISFDTETIDTDNDGIPDNLDLDSDNDGIPDNVEAQSTLGYVPPSGTSSGITDVDGDGLDDNYDLDTNSPSTATSVGLIPVNTDITDEDDYVNSDTDNDGFPDIEENGLANAISSPFTDSDNDGIDDVFDVFNGFDVNNNIDIPTTDLPDCDSDVFDGGDLDYRETPNSPAFPGVDPICEGDPLEELPTLSNNNISGSWSPPLDNTQTTVYTFTPDDFSCGTEFLLEIVVNPQETPIFSEFGPICFGEQVNALPTTSNNGISGAWSPEIDNTQTTTYTFTPNEGECAIPTTVEIEVVPNETPTFEEQPAYCSGESINPLPTTSQNGIEGTWSPELNNTETTSYTFTPNDGECAEETTLTVTIIETIIPEFNIDDNYCIEDDIPPLPTTSDNGFTGSWAPDLNNTMTTTYTFTPDQGLGCVEETTITITIDPGIIPQFDSINPICEGDTLNELPTVSLDGISGSWAPELNTLETTVYTFTPDEGQCAQNTELTINVNPVNEVLLNAVLTSEPFDNIISVQLQASGGDGNYEYRVNNGPWQSSDLFTNLAGSTEYVFEARQVNTCSNIASDSVTALSFPGFFTPNGDGINDYWNIRELRNQSEATIYIFDRYGKLLEQIYPVQIGWDGTYNGRPMPSQDYWFIVEFTDEITGNKLSYNNHFTLKR